MKGVNIIRTAISLAAVVLILTHNLSPRLRIDVIKVGLLVLLVFPWLTFLIESAVFPGGWQVKFRDVEAAGSKITSKADVSLIANQSTPSFLHLATEDSSLILIGLRIEIETRLRKLAKKLGLPAHRSPLQLIREFQSRNLFNHDLLDGLCELVRAGNNAAHGARVEPQVAQWAIDNSPSILAALDKEGEP